MSNFNDAFWKWFGDSKVVDSNGQPLVVYHGSKRKEKISVFKIKNDQYTTGFYATSSHDVAGIFAWNGLKSGTIYPLYLKIERPFIVDAKGHGYFHIPTPSTMKSFVRSDMKEVDTDLVAEFAFKNGYDGAIIHDVAEGGYNVKSDVFVVFDPHQIKSIDNDGTWDADDADIRSNPGMEFLPYIQHGMKGLLFKNGKMVGWEVDRSGSPHHQDIVEEHFPNDKIIAQLGQERHGTVYVVVDQAKSEDEAIDVVAKALPAFNWEGIYDDGDMIIDWGYKPNTRTYEESITLRIRELPKIGLRRGGSNPRKRR